MGNLFWWVVWPQIFFDGIGSVNPAIVVEMIIFHFIRIIVASNRVSEILLQSQNNHEAKMDEWGQFVEQTKKNIIRSDTFKLRKFSEQTRKAIDHFESLAFGASYRNQFLLKQVTCWISWIWMTQDGKLIGNITRLDENFERRRGDLCFNSC